MIILYVGIILNIPDDFTFMFCFSFFSVCVFHHTWLTRLLGVVDHVSRVGRGGRIWWGLGLRPHQVRLVRFALLKHSDDILNLFYVASNTFDNAYCIYYYASDTTQTTYKCMKYETHVDGSGGALVFVLGNETDILLAEVLQFFIFLYHKLRFMIFCE